MSHTTMEDAIVKTPRFFPKKPKAAKKREKEARAKRNVNPSRQIRHALVERWIPEMDLDDTKDVCLPWSYPYNNEFCGKCEKCTNKPAKVVETGMEELTFDYA